MVREGTCILILMLCWVPLVHAQPQPAKQGSEPWSVRMAASVMERCPIIRERWDYETGTVLRGIEELWKKTGDARYFDYIKQNVDEYVGPDGTIRTYKLEDYNLDNINTGKLLFPLYEQTGDERYHLAASTLHKQLQDQPTTSEGGYWHKQRYPYQMWLDGLYMAEPFAARYATTWGDPGHVEEAFHHIAFQFELAARYLRDPATGLFYHGWDEKREQIWADALTGRSANFWGRAVGWYAMALVDVLDYFPKDHPERGQIIRILQNLAEAVGKVQDPVTGVWYQILDQPNREGNYLEASASSMFVYALAKGAREGYLDPEYLAVARRGYDGLIEQFVTVEDGLVNLNRVVSVGGLGGDNDRDDVAWESDRIAYRTYGQGLWNASEYEPWEAGGVAVSEVKRITMDAGAHLFKSESTFEHEGADALAYVVGFVKRKEGLVGSMKQAAPAWAWLSAWRPVERKNGGHGALGTAALLDRGRLVEMRETDDHYLALLTATPGEPTTQYVGAGWTASSDFDTVEDWWAYLDAFAQRLQAPLRVTVLPTRP